MIRRSTKLNKEPDPQEESSDGSDSGEDQTQPKKLIVKRTPKMKSVGNEDSENVPTSSAKKGKAKTKKASKAEAIDAETTEKPKQTAKKVKGKKPVKSIEPEEASNSSDAETTEKPKQTVKKVKGKKPVKSIEPEEASNSSDEETTEKPKQTVKKVKGKKPVKSIEPEEASNSSDEETTEKPKQTVKKVKGRKPVKSIEPEEASNSSDEEITEKPKQTVKKTKGKKPVKSIEPEEASNSSDEETTEKPKQMVKKVKGKKSVKSVEPEEASNSSESTEKPKQAIKRSKSCRKKAVKSDQPSSVKEIVKENPEDSSDSEKKVLKTIKKEKGKKIKKEPDAAEYSDESEDTKWKIKNNIKALRVEVEAQTQTLNYSDIEVKPDIEEDLSDGEISSDSGIKYDMEKYKDSMENLKSIDPDFYKFLKQHDAELLNLDDDEFEEREDDNESDIHVPDDILRVDSDDSDFEDNNAVLKRTVTQQMITDLNNKLIKVDGKITLSSLVLATKLFNGAVKRATSDDGNSEGEFKVSGSGVFNNIVNMCVLYLPAALRRYLGIKNSDKDPGKCKHFVKIKNILVQYLSDLLKLITVVSSNSILTVMLKHLHHMSAYTACFLRISKRAIRTLLPLWSSGDETIRVLAFVCMLRLARKLSSEFLEAVLKAMYMTYVKNSKFVSPTTWPGINFMRRSLVEMFLLNLDILYTVSFVYIRQLGIHLRNAIMVPKKENTQAVYNWQYLNSLHLWAEIIPKVMHQPRMNMLLFPLTMIVSNAINMKPTPQYYPLRFFLTEILIQMTRDSRSFIPIQGYLMDVLTMFDFNKKHKKVSMKPLDFSCLIRLNKSQMSENGFKDAVVERVYALLLEYMTDISCELCFPDVTILILIQLEEAANKCTVANYKRKFKQLHDKIKENAKFIRNIRYAGQMSLLDGAVVRAEEKRIEAEGTPLMAFYENWKKVSTIQKRKAVTENDQVAGEMPIIKRRRIFEDVDKILKTKTDVLMKLFPSDSEDETDAFKTRVDNDEPPKDKSKLKTKRNNKEKVKKNEVESPDVADNTADAGDIVQEFSW